MTNILASEGAHYQIQSCLGRGSQGAVFRAQREDVLGDLKQTVAVKILHSWNSVQEWRSEFQSLLRVESPHCVRVYGFDRLHGNLALILEYIEGCALGDLIESPFASEIPWREIAAQVARGLEDLSVADLWHGDLSPSNILIRSDGVVKLVDFGLANAGSSGRKATPAYAAPEVFWDEEIPSLQGDLYALAQILHKHSSLSSDAWVHAVLESPLGVRPSCSYVSDPKGRSELGRLVSLYKTWSRQQMSTVPVDQGLSVPLRPQGHRTLRVVVAAIIALLLIGSSEWKVEITSRESSLVLTKARTGPILPP